MYIFKFFIFLYVLHFILLIIHLFILHKTHVDKSIYNWNGHRA